MNTNRFGRLAAASIIAALALTGCGVDIEAPSLDISGDRSDVGKGVNTGDNKLPPDSRP